MRTKIERLLFIVVFCASILLCGNKTAHNIVIREDWERLRREMVDVQIVARGIKDKKVINAMLKVPRHLFIPENYRREAYEDHPVPIGYGQTISQPYIVAFMTEAVGLKGDEKVLEIGTGSGYQAAILAEIVKEVYTIEIIEPLAKRAQETLKNLGYKNVKVFVGDGYNGLPQYAPFDVIIITAAAPRVPEPLKSQLKVGGRMILPLGENYQDLVLITKYGKNNYMMTTLLPVIFVPMTGEIQKIK